MKRNHLSTTLFLALATASAVGCAADAPGQDDDDDMTQPPEDLPVPLTPAGRFAVQSDFDVAANMPGTAGTIANYFINATNDPDDPTRFILEKAAEALPEGSFKNALNQAIPLASGIVNDKLLQLVPDFVTKIVAMGNGFGDIAHHFGTIEILEIDAAGKATKTVQGLHFKVNNIDLDYMFRDYGLQDVKVENLKVTLEQSGKLTIAPHKVPLKYGSVLKIAMNNAIIPMIDPSVTDLEGLLKSVINCNAVGTWIYDHVGFLSASTFESACNSGLAAGSAAFYKALDNLDVAALEFNLTGTARGVDKNRDGKMDDIQTGVWTGELAYSGTPAPLATAKFFGKSM